MQLETMRAANCRGVFAALGFLLLAAADTAWTQSANALPDVTDRASVLRYYGPPEWTVVDEISSLGVVGDQNVIFKITLYSPQDIKSCGKTDWYLLPPYVSGADEMWEMLKFAFAHQRPVDIRISHCEDNRNVITGVVLK